MQSQYIAFFILTDIFILIIRIICTLMSKEIISSAYSFSRLSEDSENTREENGKFIKTWRINTNTIVNEAQIEEE